MPTVSVIIPAYNQARFLCHAVESVLAQTFADHEIIVVDDGSTDETPQVLASYGDRIRVVTQANAGLSAARNSGLRAARGEMIGFLDSDDLWYPDMLSTTVSYLREHPEVDLVCGAWDYIDKSGRTIKGANRPSAFEAEARADFLRTLALGNLFPVHALLIRRKCFDCCGLFDTALRALEDWDLWLRMAIHGHQVGFTNVPIARYRRHSGCMTFEPKRMERAFHQALANLFSNEEAASRLANLRDHVYMIQWLFQAEYCQEAGLPEDLRRCIKGAEEIQKTALPNEALGRRYLTMASRLPYTERFCRAVSDSAPELLAPYYRIRFERSLRTGDFGRVLLDLVELATSHPGWLVRRATGKIGRKLMRTGWGQRSLMGSNTGGS